VVVSVTSDSFLSEALLLEFTDDDKIAEVLYNVASVVPPASQLLTEDNDPSVMLTTGVDCPAPASVQNVYILQTNG